MQDVDIMIKTGRLGADPELDDIPGGKTVCHINIAVDKGYFDSEQNWVDVTEWHPLELWNEKAVRFVETCRKGDTVFVECSSRLNKFTKQDGTQVEQLVGVVKLFKMLDNLSKKAMAHYNHMMDVFKKVEQNPEAYKDVNISELLSQVPGYT